jgi:hypothetical protein
MSSRAGIPASLQEPDHSRTSERVFYHRRRVANRCPRCLELEDELLELRHQLAAVGRYIVPTAGPNTNPDLERELKRWLAVNSRADAAAGFRAGWARLARVVRPKLREWEARWFRAMRENDRLKARIGNLLREINRLSDGA